MNQYSKEYFFSEVLSLRNLMGDINFWKKPEEHHDGALKGLTIVYLNIKIDEFDSSCSDVFQATIFEFSKRKQFMKRSLANV